MHSRIFKGRVIHHRLQPHKHRFSYGLFMMYLDLDELPVLFDKFRFWSAERFALACFNMETVHGINKKRPMLWILNNLLVESLKS